ncbi:prepilin-type N-terminal cleavage/methylation domain-containing protein [Desulfuromonas sp. AOP6]|uniref:type IV pilin protein n=1 Tax=Desulfuromonas sp. AOP6 TaxID=1566351 RepID=UPI001287F3FB|nr:prepilin-type N-terminal cleavage/methylation domain-containing protein [Desulfuromonas sp. AOP6]BCA80179.1 type II secretion system pseudopilin OxpG [Desulfuromonas sp. AOP6]
MNSIFRYRTATGFTLIELLIIMSVIGILFSIAVPSYKNSLIKARESVLMEDLFQMRSAIDAYFADNGRYPDSLEDLTEGKYLRSIPRDPFTRSAETWVTTPPAFSSSGELAEGQVFDVHSGSNLISLGGTPYKDW